MAAKSKAQWALLISCEHAGNKIPREYNSRVTDELKELLQTHRGWDRGALQIAKEVSRTENAPLYFTELSRLLIDCNRSIHHKSCLGPTFRDAPEDMKEQIARDFYYPYRKSVMDGIERLRKEGFRVLHCAFHSFTPIMDGIVRNAEFGLLYDPGQSAEKRWADIIMNQLKEQEFPWRMRRNYPYLGKSDGFTKMLRGKFGGTNYAGFELEFNQAIFEERDGEKVKILKKEMIKLFAALDLSRA